MDGNSRGERLPFPDEAWKAFCQVQHPVLIVSGIPAHGVSLQSHPTFHCIRRGCKLIYIASVRNRGLCFLGKIFCNSFFS